MSRLGIFGGLVAVGIYGGTLLKPQTPEVGKALPQITAAINHGEATVTPVRWGRVWGGYYGPSYGYGAYYPSYGYSSYAAPYWGGGYYNASPYYYGGSPYYSWWW